MADINVVIKISEEDYATIMSDKTHQPRSLTNLEWKIANGIPLPKGTKRIVDADKLYYKKMYFEGSYKSDVVVFAKDIDKKSIMI